MFNLWGTQETFPRTNNRFFEKGYNEWTVRKQIERVDHQDRSLLLLLKNCKPKCKDSVPFLVTCNSVLPNIKEIINKHSHILNIDSTFKKIFNSLKLMIAFSKNKLKTIYRNKHNKKQPKIYHTYTSNNCR